MIIKRVLGSLWLIVWVLMYSAAYPIQSAAPVVRAILFYSPYCPHCHQLITVDLPPLMEKYGDQLQILGVDTSESPGFDLFVSAAKHFNIPKERQVVPMLIIDDIILVGSIEIPQILPGLVEMYLAQGGMDWPDIPGLDESIDAAPAGATPTPEIVSTPIPDQPTALTTSEPYPTPTSMQSGLIMDDRSSTSLRDRLARDPIGNALAILVLIGMLLSVGGVLVILLSKTDVKEPASFSLAIPLLCLMGLIIAFYLAYIEISQATAVCGPVGDCNTVQQSEYARLFGFLPIGVLGFSGYLVILLVWLGNRYGSGLIACLASIGLLSLTLFGTLFSIYLTFLEPFVIGASCVWCLSSAVIMTVLMWLSVIPGKHALVSLRFRKTHVYSTKQIKRSVQE